MIYTVIDIVTGEAEVVEEAAEALTLIRDADDAERRYPDGFIVRASVGGTELAEWRGEDLLDRYERFRHGAAAADLLRA